MKHLPLPIQEFILSLTDDLLSPLHAGSRRWPID